MDIDQQTRALPQLAGGSLTVEVGEETVVLRNANTTIGYASFSRACRSLDYIFVNPAFRRRGYGRTLVALCERACESALSPAPPLSPLGEEFFVRLAA